MNSDNYILKVVYKKLSESERSEVINLWVSEGAVPHHIAIQRVEHVVCTITDKETEKIIAVSTAPPKIIQGKVYYTFGIYVSIDYRDKGVAFLRKQPWINNTTIETIKKSKPLLSDKILAFVENPKITRKIMSRKTWGWKYDNKYNVYYIDLKE